MEIMEKFDNDEESFLKFWLNKISFFLGNKVCGKEKINYKQF